MIDPRNGAPKRLTPPRNHPGMTAKQNAGFLNGGLSHPFPGAPVADDANVLDPTKAGGKPFLGKTCPPAAKDMRSRTNNVDRQDLSEAVLGEAFAAADRSTRIAHNRETPEERGAK